MLFYWYLNRVYRPCPSVVKNWPHRKVLGCSVTLPVRKDFSCIKNLHCLYSSALSMQRPVVMDTNNGTPRKRHVLIVDDDIQLAWSLKETLENDGYQATIVPDGALALKFVLGHHLD